jgi:ferredoxin-type protein NapH
MSAESNPSLSLVDPYPSGQDAVQRMALGAFAMGLLALVIAAFGPGKEFPQVFFWLAVVLGPVGATVYVARSFLLREPGVRNEHIWHRSLFNRGVAAWVFGVLLTGFYVALYWGPESYWNDAALVRVFDPLSKLLTGSPADRWFLYGAIYTLCILVMGVRAIAKYRHSNYQMVRTGSIMFFQLGFAFLIPQFLKAMDQPEFYFTYFWPLKPDYFWPEGGYYNFGWILDKGGLGLWMLLFAAAMTFIATPILTYFYGKRWYCSWVCGCGGLANTAGDPFRQLSDKSLKAWEIERWSIHLVLVIIIIITALLWVNSFTGGGIFGSISHQLSKLYAFIIIQAFSGVIGVGFYPLLGTRVWCRFGCPMAAYLGLLQKYFSRFRITTNGGQCISCGNCSTYCEMGIDVKSYAQRGENIVRASCVGCGICSTVCPRGVLNLENGPSHRDRENGNPITFGNDGVSLRM